MQVKGITDIELKAAAAEVGVEIELETLNIDGTRHRVKLYPKPPESAYTPADNRRAGEAGDAPYQRVSVHNDTRRVNAVCWHGFRDFFRACFRRQPDAIFRTAMDTWKGSDDFEMRYRHSGAKNIGSPIHQVCAAEACRCPESGTAR